MGIARRIYNVLMKGPLRVRELFGQWRYKRAHGKELVLIYTMGKVGTTTLSVFFQRQHPTIPVHHVHFLSDNWVKNKLLALPEFFHSNIPVAEEVYRSIKQHPGYRLKIFTFVREPLSREISDIFQNSEGFMQGGTLAGMKPDELKDYLDKQDHEYVLTWFDTEFREWTGFDIYSKPFDRERGYSIYKTEKADILCVKMEKMNEMLPTALKEFMDLDMQRVTVANTSEMKEGKELYSEIKKSYRAPDEKLKLLYTSKYMKHFYTEAELDNFVKAWSHNQKRYSEIA